MGELSVYSRPIERAMLKHVNATKCRTATARWKVRALQCYRGGLSRTRDRTEFVPCSDGLGL